MKYIFLLFMIFSSFVGASEIDGLRKELIQSRIDYVNASLANTEFNLDFTIQISRLIKEGNYQAAADKADLYIDTIGTLLPEQKPISGIEDAQEKDRIKRYKKIKELIQSHKESN